MGAILVVSNLLLFDWRVHVLTTYAVVNLSMDVMGMAGCMIILFTLALENNVDRSIRLFALLDIELFFIFLNYFISWGYVDDSLVWVHEVSAYLIYLLLLLLVLTYWKYLLVTVRFKGWKAAMLNLVVYAVYVAFNLLIISNYWHGTFFSIDGAGEFVSEENEWFAPMGSIILLVICAYAIHASVPDRRRKYALYNVLLMPILGQVLSTNILVRYDVLPIFIFFSFLYIYGSFYVKRSNELMKKDAALAQQRAKILISQIQPHFLYNSLTSIMNIKGNPIETRDAISDFGRFMRGNLDTLTQKSPIPLQMEIDQVETYIRLEQLSMKEKLRFELDLGSKNFLLPALTLQVLVEECVEFGLKRSENGGTITISTMDADLYNLILISDDGEGFDIEEVDSSDHERVENLKNVRTRLTDMVQGTLEFLDGPNHGTILSIQIPKSSVRTSRSFFRIQ